MLGSGLCETDNIFAAWWHFPAFEKAGQKSATGLNPWRKISDYFLFFLFHVGSDLVEYIP